MFLFQARGCQWTRFTIHWTEQFYTSCLVRSQDLQVTWVPRKCFQTSILIKRWSSQFFSLIFSVIWTFWSKLIKIELKKWLNSKAIRFVWQITEWEKSTSKFKNKIILTLFNLFIGRILTCRFVCISYSQNVRPTLVCGFNYHLS